MRAGKMNHIIDIMQATRKETRTGSGISTWTVLHKGVRARTDYRTQSMTHKNGNYVLTSSLVFTMRYKPDVTEYNRIVWEKRKYRITQIRRFPERGAGEMEIYAELIDE